MKAQVIGSFEEAVETGNQAVKQNVKAFVKAGMNQVKGDNGTNEPANQNQSKMSDDQAKSFLKDLYGKTKDEKELDKRAKENEGKTPEELTKLENLRKQLHQDYYQSLTPKPKQEERPAEKIEREEQQERWELVQKEKKKPAPLPANVKQGTGEKVVGVSG